MLVTGGLGNRVERLRVHIALALTSDKRYTNYSADPPKKPNYLHFYVTVTRLYNCNTYMYNREKEWKMVLNKKRNSKTLSRSYQRHICIWCYLEWHTLQQKMQNANTDDTLATNDRNCDASAPYAKFTKRVLFHCQKLKTRQHTYVIHQRPKYGPWSCMILHT